MDDAFEGLPARYGGRFFTEGVPENEFPDEAWMELPAHKVVADNLHRNFIERANLGAS